MKDEQYIQMEEKEMESVLIEFYGSREYQAALQYVQRRDKLVLDSLKSTDPFRNPTDIARTQGIGTGLFDLFDYIKLLVKKEADKEKVK